MALRAYKQQSTGVVDVALAKKTGGAPKSVWGCLGVLEVWV